MSIGSSDVECIHFAFESPAHVDMTLIAPMRPPCRRKSVDSTRRVWDGTTVSPCRRGSSAIHPATTVGGVPVNGTSDVRCGRAALEGGRPALDLVGDRSEELVDRCSDVNDRFAAGVARQACSHPVVVAPHRDLDHQRVHASVESSVSPNTLAHVRDRDVRAASRPPRSGDAMVTLRRRCGCDRRGTQFSSSAPQERRHRSHLDSRPLTSADHARFVASGQAI